MRLSSTLAALASFSAFFSALAFSFLALEPLKTVSVTGGGSVKRRLPYFVELVGLRVDALEADLAALAT